MSEIGGKRPSPGAVSEPGPHEWRPIETAPIGTRVLIAGRYANGIGWVEESSRWPNGHFPGRKLEPPTHWMPLPEPPRG